MNHQHCFLSAMVFRRILFTLCNLAVNPGELLCHSIVAFQSLSLKFLLQTLDLIFKSLIVLLEFGDLFFGQGCGGLVFGFELLQGLFLSL